MQRVNQVGVSLLIGALVLSCAKHESATTLQNSDPSAVPVTAVQSILIAATAEQAGECSKAIRSAGGKLLYANQSGLLLTDLNQQQVALLACEAQVSANETLSLTQPPAPKTPVPDVSTLLKLIPAEEMGARSHIAANPAQDGRGVTVAILDTGVELDHPMLRKTSTGEDKVIAFEDFSREGMVTLRESTATEYEGVVGTEFKEGVYAGAALKYSEDLKGVDTFEDVKVITYLNAQNQRAARIDTDADGSFANEVELRTYADDRKFTKLGKKKRLTVSVTLNTDGSQVNLCFDDGTHGTHVAGIATGFDPNGLSGVAPGAQVVAVKIGDSRLSGGSTTTASMLLGIDYAVAQKAQVINLSYGIRAGSNLGTSAIDSYVDKIALEKGVLFSISAGNEGPGLLTVGVPAGATRAITNAAYVSKETAKGNYGYNAVEDDNTWWFSSVGPRFDGGWKPSLLAPGSAVASVPPWSKLYQNYRGTSMASPQVTGGLALVLSAAKALGLPQDRVSVTQSVYEGAKLVKGLLRIEQGHGLMQVPAAIASLKKRQAILPVEYGISVNSPTSPTGKGQGIFLRTDQANLYTFTVAATAQFPAGTPTETQDRLRTLKLLSSKSWISTPPTIWIHSLPKTFQIQILAEAFAKPGLYSELVQGVDEETGMVAFEVPVTVIVPEQADAKNQYLWGARGTARVGQTQRHFVQVPRGATAAIVDLESDGPVLWGQLLDHEGRQLISLRDSETTEPMPKLLGQANLSRGGVLEFDVTAPAYNGRKANYDLRIQFFGLQVESMAGTDGEHLNVGVTNLFTPTKIVSSASLLGIERSAEVTLKKNDFHRHTISVTKTDKETYSNFGFQVQTSKAVYDAMTDYPWRLFDPSQELIEASGFELLGEVELPLESDSKEGDYTLEILGAFTKEAPELWSFELNEMRTFTTAKALFAGNRVLLAQDQQTTFAVPVTEARKLAPAGWEVCPLISLANANGRVVQTKKLCTK